MPTTSDSEAAVQEVERLLDEFDRLQSKLSHLGAADTEPDGVMQAVVYQALLDTDAMNDVWMPGSAYDWQLFREMPGAEGAARALTKALKAMLDELAPLMRHPAARKALRNRLWRIW